MINYDIEGILLVASIPIGFILVSFLWNRKGGGENNFEAEAEADDEDSLH